MDHINPLEFHLLIDEYHSLFTQYSLRKKAVSIPLKNYKAFGSFTFMTATPIEDEFKLDELKDIAVLNAEWEESLTVKIQAINNKRGVDKTIKHQIDRILAGEFEGNYYFFVNSVKFIQKMIVNCNLNEMNCRVIYSDYKNTKLRIKRGKATDVPKKINFIISCAFEGSDFYDEGGKTVIVSDGNRSNTLIDISTQFLQIAGRIRNSKYRDYIWHVYSKIRYSDKLPYKDFKKMMDSDIEEEKSMVTDLNRMENLDNLIKAASAQKFRFFYVDKEKKLIIPDLNASKIDLYNYRILNSDYASMTNLAGQYEKNNLEVDWVTSTSNPELIPIDDITNFEDTVKELQRLSDLRPGLLSDFRYRAYKDAAINTFSLFKGCHRVFRILRVKEKLFNYHLEQLKLQIRTYFKLATIK